MTDKQIKYMRDRFLSWTLPENLNPDGGISYKRSESAIKYNHPGPVGTNFLDAEQAEAMVRHMIERLPNADDEYVGYARFRRRADNQQPYLSICDSDAEGAFKIYRHTLAKADPPGVQLASSAEEGK